MTINIPDSSSNNLTIGPISKSYYKGGATKLVLDKVGFKVKEGGFITLFGPNGCGKTTLLKLIAGLIEPDAGEAILTHGKRLDRSKTSFLFQNYSDTLLPWKSCLDNIAFPLELYGIGKSERRKRATSFTNDLGISLPLDQYPYQCSEGQKQLTALARALILRPELLLMDEPFSALDYDTRISLQIKLLEIWERSKVTTIFVSHDLDEAIFLSDKIVVFSKVPAKVVEEIEVGLSRPRSSDMIDSREFHELCERLLSSVHGRVST
jgi:NitT/TauT family transport system ATP-binding protein